MTRDQALGKIKKCLALAKSDNPHEAAAAMRQAQKLMAEHLLTEGDVSLADIAQSPHKTRTADMTEWEVLLAGAIAESFACALIWTKNVAKVNASRVTYKREVVFYGSGSAATVAGYAWEVLSMQCARGRLAHMRAQSARCLAVTKTARGDKYAIGWVLAVLTMIKEFASPDKDSKLLAEYAAQYWPQVKQFNAKDRTLGRNASSRDFMTGLAHGRKARLNHGVRKTEHQLSLPL